MTENTTRQHLYKGKAINLHPKLTPWVYGYLSGEKTITVYAEQDFNDFKIISSNKIEVIRSTICEFTGLTDKNGKKIFEGDIVFYTDIFDEGAKGKKYIVGIGECMALDDLSGYGVYIQEQESDKMLLNADELTLSRIEVVGNIYDNPELLK